MRHDRTHVTVSQIKDPLYDVLLYLLHLAPSKPSFTIALISSSVTLFSSFVSTPVIFTANAVLFESSQTKGDDMNLN